MSKVCDICKKSTVYGNRDTHHHATGWAHSAPNRVHKTRPNLRTAKLLVNGVMKRVKVCMKCYKSLSKKGSN
ncbi:50S ribosomal protein L28 [Candidatus Dojkabacteria bacterium]|nr:50S ribosomal protein L28 [Candidatus Dojkabacteria bacterium]